MIVAMIFLISGCGTMQFDPPVHELRETSIPDFKTSGKIEILNEQSSIEPAIIHSYGGIKYESDYQKITETMVDQAKSELDRHGINNGDEKAKTIGLKVTHLNSRYIAFYWKGTMSFTVFLGDGEGFDITVNHGTGAGAAQDLSGSIADGVVALFTHEKVKAYLAE